MRWQVAWLESLHSIPLGVLRLYSESGPTHGKPELCISLHRLLDKQSDRASFDFPPDLGKFVLLLFFLLYELTSATASVLLVVHNFCNLTTELSFS